MHISQPGSLQKVFSGEGDAKDPELLTLKLRGGQMADVKVDEETFGKRLKQLYDCWEVRDLAFQIFVVLLNVRENHRQCKRHTCF
jgi:hypothetical protein